MTLDELQTIADNMRPYTADAMKIEVAPWIKDYVVDMEELYTDLSLEKTHNKPTGEDEKALNNYKELFENCQSVDGTGSPAKRPRKSRKSKKVLMKGDPGMGKTTQCKKICWDWATKLFTYFHIIFFVFLKLVKPGDAIENVIIKHNPYMKGLEITEQKVRSILQLFGGNCLLILDGLDEHALGTNQDVLAIIRGEKYLKCNIIVTSRPHSTGEIERYFPTVVRVEGFTRKNAEHFASKILTDKEIIEVVLNYKPTAFRKYVPIHKCPILLSFLCLLVKENDIDLSNTQMHTGEIYIRMVRCLYKKYVIRKGLSYDNDQFKTTMTKIGKLALETLLSGDPLLKRADVIKEVGPDAFDYGLLIGHEDFMRLILDETADIYVTFPHRSIQEFLGAFYFIWILNKGKEIHSLFSVRTPIFMMNTLFLQFCLWFLSDDQDYMKFENRQKVYQTLEDSCVQLMNSNVFDVEEINSKYPALGVIPDSVNAKDELRASFLTDILTDCDKTSKLVLPSTNTLDSLLGSINPIWKTVTSIQHGEGIYHIGHFKGTEIAIKADKITAEHLDVILEKYTRAMKTPVVHLYLQEPHRGTKKVSCANVKRFHLRSLSHFSNAIFLNLTRFGSHRTHLSLQGISNKIVVTKEIHQLSEAANSGKMLNLSHLSIVECVGMEGKLPILFKSAWPQMKNLNLLKTHLSEKDLDFLFLACNAPEKTLPNLESLSLTIGQKVKEWFCTKFSRIIG